MSQKLNHETTRNDTKKRESFECLVRVVSCRFVVKVFLCPNLVSFNLVSHMQRTTDYRQRTVFLNHNSERAREDAKFERRVAAHVAVGFDRERVGGRQVFDADARAARDAHARVLDVAAAMDARHLADERGARETAGGDDIEQAVVYASTGREHHAAARERTVDHGDEIRRTLERLRIINLNRDAAGTPARDCGQSRERKTRFARKPPPYRLPLRRDAPGHLRADAERRRVEAEERARVVADNSVQHINGACCRRFTLALSGIVDEVFEPVVERGARTFEAAREIVARAGG